MHARLYKFYAPERETVVPIYGWAKSERTAKKYRNMLNRDPRNYYARVYEEITDDKKIAIWDGSGVDLKAEVRSKHREAVEAYLLGWILCGLSVYVAYMIGLFGSCPLPWQVVCASVIG